MGDKKNLFQNIRLLCDWTAQIYFATGEERYTRSVNYSFVTLVHPTSPEASVVLGPDLQCLLKVKEDLNLVLIFQDAKNIILN